MAVLTLGSVSVMAEQWPAIITQALAHFGTGFLISSKAAAVIGVHKWTGHSILTNVTGESFWIEALRALDYEENITQRVSHKICLPHHFARYQ